MPLQHASQNVLKLMKRGGDRKSLERLIERVRKRVPGIAVRTTFISGFPGETEADFEELMSFIKNVEFDRVGVFTYSDEEGTPAFDLPDKIVHRIASRRRTALMKEQAKSHDAKTEVALVKWSRCCLKVSRRKVSCCGREEWRRRRPTLMGACSSTMFQTGLCLRRESLCASR